MKFFIGLLLFDLVWLALVYLIAKLNGKYNIWRNQLSNNPDKMPEGDIAKFATDLPRTMVFISINALVILNIAAIIIYMVNR